ncbi:MAG TPA: ABC transporter permease [Pseudolabrys sp.]|jgi:ABC-2 type transport system permease protein
MTQMLPANAPRRERNGGFLRKTWAVLIKEFIQLKRDRVSFGMIIMLPLMQLMLFGYAINTNPRDLPTAVLFQEHNDLTRSIIAALQNTRYFKITEFPPNEVELDKLLASGKVLFAIEIPANFERAVRRGDKPTMWVAGDATDPVASGSAMGSLGMAVQSALLHDRAVPDAQPQMPFEIRAHARYNPAGQTQLNIVPGLVGTILTMTMLVFTALSVTREIERGTMETLLSMPITPVEIMLGKIVPYVFVGFIQASLIIFIGVFLFDVPLIGSLTALAGLSTLFIAGNLATGYTFSTIAQNQLQAMQMTLMYFLPNMLLSGFMFPFAGMPVWAQWIGEAMPLTHYLRIVRSIMLKGSSVSDLHYDAAAMFILMLLTMAIAVMRFRRTLD